MFYIIKLSIYLLDLRHVNKYVSKNRVKYENWRTALTYFQINSFMISFDLKSGYHHVDIHPESQTFLGFAWKGTKCLKPLEKHWGMQGINIAICLDDGWLTEMSSDDCKKLSETVRQDIRDAG